MGLKQLIRRLVNEKEPERKLQDPEKNQKKVVRIDPLERIAALKAADWDLTILLCRTGGISQGATSKQWHITEVDPLTFYEMVSEALGGGAYRMEFRKPDSTILRLEGSEKLETHTFTVAGKPKGTAEAKEKAKSGDFWQDFMKEGSIGQMLIKVFLEQRGKPDEVLMELLKTAIAGTGSHADPTALLANVTETVVKLKEAASDSGGVDPLQSLSQVFSLFNQFNAANKPPVVATGSNASGLDKFFESLGNAAPAFAPLIAGAFNRGNGQEPTPAAGLPAPVPEPEQQTAFAGTEAAADIGKPDLPPGDPPKVNPLAAFSAQDLGGEVALSSQSAAFGAVMKLRYMIGQEADPLDIASEMVDTINLIKGAKRVDGIWENYIDDPGEAFDEFAPLIPEWLENPQYRTDCREAMVKAITDYFEDGAEIEIDDATHDTESTIEASAETAPHDTVVGTLHDEGENDDSIIDG